MPIDLVRLESERTRLTAAILAPRTLFIYRYGWRHFETWCEDAGIVALPCSSITLALYVVSAIDRGLKVATAAVHIAAVIHQHKLTGHVSPSGKDIQNLLSGARRTLRQQPQGKLALTVGQLTRIASMADSSARGERDRGILILGFATGLRRAELAALNLCDLEFVPEGLQVRVGKTKTDQEGVGRIIGIWPGKSGTTCPIRAVERWLAVRGTHSGALFPFVSQRGIVTEKRISGEAVCCAVKRCVQQIGLDPVLYGGHSLRSGCVTACVIAGASVLSIMERTGHKSTQTISRYVRMATPFDVNPLAGAL